MTVFAQLLLLLLSVGCIKNTSQGLPVDPGTMRSFAYPPDQVWKVTLDVVQVDFLIPIEFFDSQHMYFSSELVADEPMPLQSQYRVSGTASPTDQGSVVQLYKHQQILTQDQWKTLPSDLVLEKAVLQRIEQRLKARP